MRTLKELLIILRDNARVESSLFGIRKRIYSGLCYECGMLHQDGIFSIAEMLKLKLFLLGKVRLSDYKYGGYLFPRTLWRCRKKWLDKQINQLN